MQAQQTAGGQWAGRRGGPGAGRRPGLNFSALGRAIRYLRRHPRTTIIAYGALIIASLAQLAVPKLVQNMVDAISNGSALQRVQQLPTAIQPTVLDKLGKTIEQLTADHAAAESLLINAALIIVALSAARALSSFIQTYMAENTSQGVAFDFRNELFEKIQRLSFSYHDRNQTGQLMIRATDDVEKVRLFIAQGLMLALQALILVIGALII